MKHALAPRDLLLTLAIVTLWGFSFVPIKVGLRELPPFALAALRFFFAAVPLVLVIKRPRMPWRDVAGYGLAIGLFQFGLLFLGMKLGMPAGLSSLVIQVQVFFTIGLAIAFLGDRLQRHHLVGAGIATAGIAVLAAQKLIDGAHATLVGFALVLVAAFAWAVGNVISKRAAAAHDADMFSLVVWSSLIPPLPLALVEIAGTAAPEMFARAKLGRIAHENPAESCLAQAIAEGRRGKAGVTLVNARGVRSPLLGAPTTLRFMAQRRHVAAPLPALRLGPGS